MNSVQSNDSLTFVLSGLERNLPALEIPREYQFSNPKTGVEINEWIGFVCKSGEFLNCSPAYYHSSMVRFLVPGGAFVVKWYGQIVACLALVDFHQVPGRANLTYLLVDKDFRRLGLGEELMNRAVNLARDRGYKEVALSTQSSRVKAIGLFEKMGFVKL